MLYTALQVAPLRKEDVCEVPVCDPPPHRVSRSGRDFAAEPALGLYFRSTVRSGQSYASHEETMVLLQLLTTARPTRQASKQASKQPSDGWACAQDLDIGTRSGRNGTPQLQNFV